MSFENKIKEKIKDIIRKRGLKQEIINKVTDDKKINLKEKLNSIEFLAICKIFHLNFDDFTECFGEYAHK